MSQEKVDRYKKEKANRKQNLKKEKAKTMFLRLAGAAVCVALLGWIGYSGYSRWEASQPVKTTEITIEPLSEYLDGLTAED